ncbi:MAG: hypothetical protein ACLTLQ_08880 [[Clostridium] scindens]
MDGQYDIPKYEEVMEQYAKFTEEDIHSGGIGGLCPRRAAASSRLASKGWPLETEWA